MNKWLTRAVVTVVAATALGAGSGQAANAADSPALRPAPCGTSAVWLVLSGYLGQTCYTGNGTQAVDLPGVNRERIIGVHRVCLVTRPLTTIRCAVGPGTFTISPPVTVVQISISTPLV